MFITWKVEDILFSGKIWAIMLYIIIGGWFGGPIPALWISINRKSFFTYAEQRQMGQLHHCKVYQQ